jgi:hypothetical protein
MFPVKTLSASFRHLPETLRIKHQRKMFLDLSRGGEIFLEKGKGIFLWCCRVKRDSGGTMRTYGLG